MSDKSIDDLIDDFAKDIGELRRDETVNVAKLREACAGSKPSGGHTLVDEVCGLLRVTRDQRDVAWAERYTLQLGELRLTAERDALTKQLEEAKEIIRQVSAVWADEKHYADVDGYYPHMFQARRFAEKLEKALGSALDTRQLDMIVDYAELKLLAEQECEQVEAALAEEKKQRALDRHAFDETMKDREKAMYEALSSRSYWQDLYNREVLGLNNEGDPIGGDPASGLKADVEWRRNQMEAVAKYLQPNWSNDLPWADEIIIAIGHIEQERDYLATRVARYETLIKQFRSWDMLDCAADGPFWKGEIDKALGPCQICKGELGWWEDAKTWAHCRCASVIKDRHRTSSSEQPAAEVQGDQHTGQEGSAPSCPVAGDPVLPGSTTAIDDCDPVEDALFMHRLKHSNRNVARIALADAVAGQIPQTPTPAPVGLVMWCPNCQSRHIDAGLWATKPHKTHQCQSCQHEWRPFPYPTVGV